MQRRQLGRTGIEVSALCLGSMTWGSQNTEAEGHAQIDRALDRGVDFIDTAEMYPVNPVAKETIGRTEEIIGTWLARTGRRGDVVLATKHSGEGQKMVRDGAPISSKTIPETVEGSLRRLQTDYIDLYQFHWPNRGSYMFRKNWTFDPSGQDRAATVAHMEDALEALQKQVEKGNIRHFGLSNESAWGTSQWLRISEDRGLPRVASMQKRWAPILPEQSSAQSTPRPSVSSASRSRLPASRGSSTATAPMPSARSRRLAVDSTAITRAPRKRALMTAPSPTGPNPVIKIVSNAETPMRSMAPNDGPSPQQANAARS